MSFPFSCINTPEWDCMVYVCLTLLRNTNCFPERLYHLCSHQQCKSNPISSPPCWYLGTSVFVILVWCIRILLAGSVKIAVKWGCLQSLAGVASNISHCSRFPNTCLHSSLSYPAFQWWKNRALDMQGVFRFDQLFRTISGTSLSGDAGLLWGSTSWPNGQTWYQWYSPKRWYESHDGAAMGQRQNLLGPGSSSFGHRLCECFLFLKLATY